MSDDPNPERQIEIHAPGGLLPGIYANFAAVNASDYEVTVDFARIDFGARQGNLVARLNMSHILAEQLRAALDRVLAEYARQATTEGLDHGDPDDSR